MATSPCSDCDERGKKNSARKHERQESLMDGHAASMEFLCLSFSHLANVTPMGQNSS